MGGIRLPRWLMGRLSVWRQIFSHAGRAVIALLLGEAVTFLLLVRDNLLSPQARDALQFLKFIPSLSSAEWLTVGVILLSPFRSRRGLSSYQQGPYGSNC